LQRWLLLLIAFYSLRSERILCGASLLGGALGSSLSQKREGLFVGAGLGLLLAAALDAALDDGKRRR
jgi:hypothetical protein